jgi:hypothetical protein
VLKAQPVLAQNEILGFKLFEINRVPRARSVINSRFTFSIRFVLGVIFALGEAQLSIPVKTDFDSILEQFNKRESVNDLGYLINYITIVIEDGKDMTLELHPTVVWIPLSYYELLTATGVGFHYVK